VRGLSAAVAVSARRRVAARRAARCMDEVSGGKGRN